MNAKIVGQQRLWRIFRLLLHWLGLFFHGYRYYTRNVSGMHLLRTFFVQKYLYTEQVRSRYDAGVFLIQREGIVSQE